MLGSLLVVLSALAACYASNPRVETSLGVVEGSNAFTYTGRPYYQFEGVPYAAPPVGQLRFEKPQDPSNWTGILMAKTLTECYQYSEGDKDSDGNYKTVGDEDCLYLNIYTPTLNQSANLNVLVHIHGGAFMFGSGGSWGSDIILNKDVVYVNLNYRLGPLGFLSTEDEVLPGNLGLWDQQHALKWIKKLVKYFGGNPNSVTLHGLSAGSASIQLHCLLPGSKGYFHKAIGESGSAINNWVLMEDALQKSRKLASLVGCPSEDSVSIKNCLKTRTARQIVEKVREFQPFLYNPFSPWAVVIDGYWSKNPILPNHPLLLLKNKQIHDVPVLLSHVTSEGLYPGSEFYDDFRLKNINHNWNQVMPHILMYNETIGAFRRNMVSQAIRQFYLRKQTLKKGKPYFDLIQAMGDRNFVYDIEKGLKLHSAGIKSPVYSYVFNYRGNVSCSQVFMDTTDNIGVSHGDDTIYILRTLNTTGTPDDIKMSNLMVDMTVSFMAHGVPAISSIWKPLSKNVSKPLNLLKINKYDNLVFYQDQNIGHRRFWDSLGFKENDKLLNVSLGF